MMIMSYDLATKSVSAFDLLYPFALSTTNGFMRVMNCMLCYVRMFGSYQGPGSRGEYSSGFAAFGEEVGFFCPISLADT